MHKLTNREHNEEPHAEDFFFFCQTRKDKVLSWHPWAMQNISFTKRTGSASNPIWACNLFLLWMTKRGRRIHHFKVSPKTLSTIIETLKFQVIYQEKHPWKEMPWSACWTWTPMFCNCLRNSLWLQHKKNKWLE